MGCVKSRFLLGVFLLSLGSFLACSPSAENILTKMVEAQGGRLALEKISDRNFSGTMEMAQMGASGTVRMYQKRPNKMRMEFEMMGRVVVQVFDGKTAWGIDPQTGQRQTLPDRATKAFERQALGAESILNPEMWGIDYTYQGKEKIQDKDCYVLEQSFSDGYQSTLYVDAESYLLIKVKATDLNQTGAEVVSETYYSDYREVEGISIPYKISVFQDGEESMQVTVTDVVLNGGMGDSMFTIIH